MFIQVHSRSLNVVLSFETTMPFDRMPVWRDIRKLPLAEQEAALRNPEIRRKLVEAVNESDAAAAQSAPNRAGLISTGCS